MANPNENANTNPVTNSTENPLNMLMGANIELLKTDLNLLFSKQGNVHKFLLAPATIETDNSVTFGEMIDDFKNAFGMNNQDDITSAIGDIGGKEGGGIKPDKLRIKLNQAFLYIENSPEGTKTEFAISVFLDATEALPDMGFFRMKSLSLSVWNTKRASVLKTLSMGEFERLLPA